MYETAESEVQMSATEPTEVEIPAAGVRQQSPASPAPPQRAKQDRPRRRKTSWPWTLINFWLDSTLLVIFTALIWVSTVVRFLFPPASTAQDWMLWGLNIDQWMGLQFVLLAALTLGILIHLMLHWSWVCGVFFTRIWRRGQQAAMPDDGTRTIYGVGLMIVLLNVLGLALAAAALSVKAPL